LIFPLSESREPGFSNGCLNLLIGDKFQFFDNLQQWARGFELGLHAAGIFDLLIGQRTAFQQMVYKISGFVRPTALLPDLAFI
jgi:hypothetical protein